jgi:ATP synthase protein I
VSFPTSNPAIQTERSKDRPGPFFEAAQVSSVGIEMAVATFVGWGAGYWLDARLETGPWLMLAGLLLGVAAGFKGLIQTAKRVNAQVLTNEVSPDKEPAA